MRSWFRGIFKSKKVFVQGLLPNKPEESSSEDRKERKAKRTAQQRARKANRQR